MRILLFGKNGQIGWELKRALSPLGEVTALSSKDEIHCGDLSNVLGIAETIRKLHPDVVVNAAAYTDVDDAESEPELSYLLNAEVVEVIAKETAKINALFVHYSTDYVFDGSGKEYRVETDNTVPLNVYGNTKLAGEYALRLYNPRHLIFRTSWVYSLRGKNFAKTILRLAKEKENLSIVNDQFGAPTGAELLADCTALAIRQEQYDKSVHGVYHLVASGYTTWFEYANFIFSFIRENNISLRICHVNGVSASSYRTPALRPSNSRLNNNKFMNTFGIYLPNWGVGVQRMLSELFSGEYK